MKDIIRENVERGEYDLKTKLIKEQKHREFIAYIRSVVEEATSPKEDVMKLYYGIESNHCKPIRVDEKITLDRIINRYGENGYIIVSANREYRTKEENVEETRRLLKDIRRSRYSYLPAYGGYRDIETGEDSDFAPSFLIFNYSNTREKRDFEKLRDLAKELCGKYDQESVMLNPPGEPPIYVDRDGNKTGKRSSNKVWENDPTKEYFTQLTPKGETTNESRKVFQIYLNPGPQQLSERMERVGEVMIWDVF